MYLASTKLLKGVDGKNFSWERIFVSEGKIIEMTVVSAFVDKARLQSLIDELLEENGRASMSDCVRLKIFIDASASRFAQEKSQTELLELNKIIKNACWRSELRTRKLFSDDSGIHLVFIKDTKLFHSKMILCKSRNRMRMVIGSVNFTQCAFNNNEELAIVGEVKLSNGVVSNAEKNNLFRQALDYEKILNDSVKENEENTKSIPKNNSAVESYKVSQNLANQYVPNDTNLYAYLMRGSLFYSKPLSFSEYFLLKLPKGVLQKKLEKDKAISSLIGKTNMKNSLSIVKLVTLSEEEGGANISLPPKAEGRNMWRSLCIPTSFGFWCPPERKEDLENEKKKNKESDYYTHLLDAISDNKKLLQDKFLKLINAIKEKIKETEEERKTDASLHYNEEIKKEDDLETWQYANEKFAIEKWNEFVKKLLANRKKLEKDCSEIIFEAKVPYLSEDVQARTEFLTSFIEAIDRIRLTNNAQGSGIVDEILKKHSSIINKAKKELGLNKE